MCVPTNKGYKTYQTGFLFYRLGHIPEGGGGRWCAEGAKEFKKIEHGHVASQTDRDDEHNIMQVKHLFLFVVALSFGKCFPVCFLD